MSLPGLLSTLCLTHNLLIGANVWIVDFTDSQTSCRETSERENKPQLGQPKESSDASTGRGDAVPVITPHPIIQGSFGWSKEIVYNCSFFCRKQLSAEWRKQRYWNTLFSFYRKQETRIDVKVLVEARKTPSKKASQTAWRELLASWDPREMACTSEQRWSHLSLLAFPATASLLQAGRTRATSVRPPAHSCSGAPAHPFFTSACGSLGLCRGSWCSAAFRTQDTLTVLSHHSKGRMEQRNRTSFRANQPVILCGGLGPDHQTMSSQTTSSSLFHAVLICRAHLSTSTEINYAC